MATTMQTNIAIGGILSPSLQKVFSSVSQYASKTSATLAQVNSKTAAVSSYAGQQFSNTQAKIKAALVTGGIAAAGTKIGGVMLDQASSLEQYRNTLNIVMKDNTKAAQTFAWANEYANKTPFETGEIVDATVKLTSYGLEAQKVLPLTGDMAAAMGKSIDQATEAVADAQTGELERLKEFGITKDMIVAQGAKNLAGIEIVNNKGQITNQKAFNATLFSLMKERYSGAMDIQSKTYGGLMSTVSGIAKSGLSRIAGISETGEIIDGSAFDVLKEKLTGFTDKLTQMQADGTFDIMADKFTGFVQNVVEGADFVWPKIQSLFNYVQENGPQIMQIAQFIGRAFIGWKVISTVSSGIQAISSVHKSLLILKSGYTALSIAKAKDKLETLYLNALYAKDAIVKGASTVATGAQTAAQWALNAAMSANPITLFIIGIVALIAIFVLLWNKCEGFRNFFIYMWQSIKSGIQSFGIWLTTAMQTDWTTSFGALGAILNSFFFIIGGIWNSIKLVFSGVIDFVSGVFAGDWSLAWSGIIQIFSGLMNGIGTVMKAPLNAVIGLINAAISSINSNIQIDVPDWIPGMGGKHFGVNIPTIPMFAKGGFTNVPSIFGEAGPEAAIPLKRNNPRSISLLEKTAATIGWDGNKSNSSPTFIFSPQISGSVDVETINQLKQSFEEFKAMVREVLNDEERVAFG
ncbi:hypothetical protein DIC82_14910 [Clostridium beijerinckii]|nr:hypothetical protein DIC82_14910 [Clostridium beijerinckii]